MKQSGQMLFHDMQDEEHLIVFHIFFQFQRGMSIVTTELTKVVNYPAIGVQVTLRRIEE